MPSKCKETADTMREMVQSGSTPGRGQSLPQGRPVTIHHYRHNLKHRFELVKTLGEGTYGKVKLGIERTTGEQVAIKYIKKTKIHDETDLNRIRREIRILSSLRHPHIVNVREVFEKKDKIVLVMDCALGGELYEYINLRKKLNEKEARRLFRQILSAVHYCHKNGVVHRDLKLENIILDHQSNVKIADFGLANFFSHNSLLSTFCGSPLYASPEIVNGQPYHGPEVDMWSLGVVLYTLVYGAMPFESSNLKILRKQISSGDYYIPSNQSEAAGLIQHMLTVNPLKRATIRDVLEHWWINFGHNQTPNHEPYPPPVRPRTRIYALHHHSFSSDSEGEFDSTYSKKALKGILKKSAESSFDEDEQLFDISSSKTCPETSQEDLNPGSSLEPPTHNISNDTGMNSDNTSGDEMRKVFDSEKKPMRGILKRKGKFSGGDSGCDMDLGPKTEDEELPKRNNDSDDLDLDFCDTNFVRSHSSSGATGAAPCEAMQIATACNEHLHGRQDILYGDRVFSDSRSASPGGMPNICSCDTTKVVRRRKGILKNGHSGSYVDDPRNRLSIGSLSSNSSADILDLSYDSGDGEQFMNQYDRSAKLLKESSLRLPNGPDFQAFHLSDNFNSLKLEGHPHTAQMVYEERLFDLEDAQQVYRQALEICHRM